MYLGASLYRRAVACMSLTRRLTFGGPANRQAATSAEASCGRHNESRLRAPVLRATRIPCRRPEPTWLVTLLTVVFLGCISCVAGAEVRTVSFEVNGSKTPSVSAELATNPKQRQLGLMYRKSLTDSQGMLFIFPDETNRSFWMKNTYIALDMIFIDKGLKVVNVVEQALPLTETPRKSSGPAKYVLEVPGGWSKRFNVGPGARMLLDESLPDVSQ